MLPKSQSNYTEQVSSYEETIRQELGLMDFQNKIMIKPAMSLAKGTLDECLKQSGILYVRGGTKTKKLCLPSERTQCFLSNSKSTLDSNAIHTTPTFEVNKTVFEYCTCFACTNYSNSNSNNSVQLITYMKNSKTKKETPNYISDSWRLVGYKNQLDEERSGADLSSQKTGVELINSSVELIGISDNLELKKTEVEKNKLIATSSPLLLSDAKSSQYPWMERVNQLTSKVTHYNIIPTSKFNGGAVHGDSIPISQHEDRNGNTSLKRSSVPSGIGFLSPVKVKNPNNIAKLFGTGIDKGSRKVGLLRSKTIKIPIDKAITCNTAIPNITSSFNSMGNTVANFDERHVNNNIASFLMNSPRSVNHIFPTNLRSSMTCKINNSKYSNCLDNENLRHTGVDSELNKLSEMPNVLARENPEDEIHSPKKDANIRNYSSML